uniref:F-box domain-containing protein n=1 Tax=Panagrolaimus davidi TaxID=227884 RepID=A0A914PX63_9BILA
MSQTQEFIFPINVWDKIVTNLTGSSWINLQRTCKFFYFKSDIICVKNLEIVPNDGKIKERNKKPMMKNLILTSDNKSEIKFFVYDKLHIRTRRPISSIFSRIMKCNLEELIIEYNNLTWNEYLFLVDGGRIKKLSLEGANIKHSNGDSVLLEDIMSQIPEANDI